MSVQTDEGECMAYNGVFADDLASYPALPAYSKQEGLTSSILSLTGRIKRSSIPISPHQ